MADGAERLAEYRRRRDFAETPEPDGEAAAKARGGGLVYVVQEHHARRLHYDLRLEWDGVLLSWAVTKRPGGRPGERRLAVRTEDHPLAYADFAGEIPSGYGAGDVAIWDRGRWRPESADVAASLADGKVNFHIDGERLSGPYTLVRMKPRKGERRENWLLVARRAARTAPAAPTAAAPAEKTRARTRRASAAPPPAFAPPMLAQKVDRPPAGGGWIHEIKHDGYRVLAAIGGGGARLYTRSGRDWTRRYGSLADDFAALTPSSALIDGEIVAAGADGAPSFAALQSALREGGSLTAYCFDLLRFDGEDLRPLPLGERRTRLRALLETAPASIRFSESIAEDGAAVLSSACRLGAEGVVSKRLDGRYAAGRTGLWRKSKCVGREEFVIGGWRRSSAAGRPFASLLLGAFADGGLAYRGRVGAGFDAATAADLARRLAPLRRADAPFADAPPDARRDAVWVAPKLVAEVKFAEITPDGRLRHARFLGLREDKRASAVRDPAPSRPSGEEVPMRLTKPEKILFPEAGLSKQRVARHFETVAERMTPLVARRPLTLVRCPDGRDGECFFQKHYPKGAAEGLKRWRRGGEDFMQIEDRRGLHAAIQLGALELHIGGARLDAPEKPERLVFDLDPGPGVDFSAVREAARTLRDLLEAAGLASFPLLTGGKGVHVVVPLAPKADWETARRFARTLAYAMSAAEPARFVAKAAKKLRQGRIFIDWLRNDAAATAIAPYSPRARPGAPVATPVSWRELARVDRANAYDVVAVARRLARLSHDPWKGYEAARRPLSAGLIDAADAIRKGRGA